MKRSRYLETLSWEHHNGLVLAYRIERGLAFNVDCCEVKNYLLHLWNQALYAHFLQEEKELKVAGKKQELKDFFDQMLKDHRDFDHLVENIRKISNCEKLTPILHEFARKLNEHIRFEERQLFPQIERLIPEKDLQKISDHLHAVHQPINMDWPVKFWQQKSNT